MTTELKTGPATTKTPRVVPESTELAASAMETETFPPGENASRAVAVVPPVVKPRASAGKGGRVAANEVVIDLATDPAATAARTGSAITLVADGESSVDTEVAVDQKVIDDAVQHLNGLYARKGLEVAIEVGEYVLQMFYGGDLDAYRAKGAQNKSLRALTKRADLMVPYAFIWHSLAVLHQLRQLPADIRSALPMSHHRLLLSVKDDEMKAELARKAIDEKLSKRDLAAEVKSATEAARKGRKRGAPALPPWAKGLSTALNAVKKVARHDVTPEEVAAHGAKLVTTRLAEVDATIVSLQSLRAKLALVLS